MLSGQHEEAEEEGGEGQEDGEETAAHRARAETPETTFGTVFSRHTKACRKRCIFVEVAAAVPPFQSRG